MFHCAKCQKLVCSPCMHLSDSPFDRNAVVMASPAALRDRVYFRRLAIAVVNLGISRREIPNWIAETIFGFEGAVVDHTGRPVGFADDSIDRAFNDDGSFRWLSNFMRFATSLPRQAPQGRVLWRLALIDLALKIDRPDIARHLRR